MSREIARLPQRLAHWLVGGLALGVGACGGGDPAQPDVAPTISVTIPAGTSVAAGATRALTARVTDARGQVVASPTVRWSSSATTVATVSAEGVVSARTVGSATISGTSLGVTGQVMLTVSPGAAVKLVMRTQPTDVGSGQPFAAAPVVEVRDAFENPVTGTVPVTVSLASGGGALDGNITVTAVQGVAAFTTLTVSGVVGSRTLTFASAGLTPVTTSAFALGAGAPATLAFRTAPSGGGLNSPFTTQPVVELRDAAGNVPTAAAVTVSATITSGGGSIAGATAQTVNGAASFTTLGVTGTAGSRTISFAAPGLTALPITLSPCDASRPPAPTLSARSRAYSAFQQRAAALDTIVITDINASCDAIANAAVTVTYPGTGGWLQATLLSNPSRLALRADPATLSEGSYQAVVAYSSSNADTVTLPITFNVSASLTMQYGLVNEKVNMLDVNGSLLIAPVVRNISNEVVSPPIVFASRSPSIATVASDGRVAGRLGGQAWIVSQTVANSGAIDSIYVNVARTTGPLLRADITRFEYARNGTVSVTLILDTRGTTIGAAQVVFSWPTERATPSLLRYVSNTSGTVGSPLIVNDVNSGTTRISIAGASGMNGVITLGRFDFTAVQLGSSQFILRQVELLDLNQQSLLTDASSFQYPVVIK